MTEEEKEILKKISIRGRVAYSLLCLEELIRFIGFKNPELDSLISKIWEITSSDSLGWWQDLLIEHTPRVILQDYQLFKKGEITIQELGFSTIGDTFEFENRINFLKKLSPPIPELIDKITDIANQNLFAGCGEYSKLTLQPTIELIEIIDGFQDFSRPKITLVVFSKFSEQNGWGNNFTRNQITNIQ